MFTYIYIYMSMYVYIYVHIDYTNTIILDLCIIGTYRFADMYTDLLIYFAFLDTPGTELGQESRVPLLVRIPRAQAPADQ